MACLQVVVIVKGHYKLKYLFGVNLVINLQWRTLSSSSCFLLAPSRTFISIQHGTILSSRVMFRDIFQIARKTITFNNNFYYYFQLTKYIIFYWSTILFFFFLFLFEYWQSLITSVLLADCYVNIITDTNYQYVAL